MALTPAEEGNCPGGVTGFCGSEIAQVALDGVRSPLPFPCFPRFPCVKATPTR